MLRGMLPRALPVLASAIFWTTVIPLAYHHETMPDVAHAQERPEDESLPVRQDIDALCDLVREEYVYFEPRREGWAEACQMARAEAETAAAASPAGHLAILERLLDQLWDNHVSLNANSATSPRLVPSGSDYWLDYRSGIAVVTAVRAGSPAAGAGLEVGDIVLEMNGVPVIASAIERIRAGRNRVSEARLEWALNAQAAGVRGDSRTIQIERNNKALELDLQASGERGTRDGLVSSRRLHGNIGYIRFEDSLGNPETVEAFEAALDELRGVEAWVVDLRNTPGGGNTDVAEPVLGRFISGVKTYQLSGPRWEGESKRRAASRGPWRVKGRVAVLAGRWTGSMGEGMAIGFDGLNRARVFGTPMARLAGGVESFELPGSGLSVRLPAYDLRHVDGTPRHYWVPPYRVVADNGNGPDLALEAALNWLD
ncbi:S41 family peptidase [Henriciella sp.]|uniref:S41 family peptidase n=1 Tax=Henriciella sp. TaxID=1968823 RepID=UPI00262410C6|nr:S41 family peptidase [Henriciella sp.]